MSHRAFHAAEKVIPGFDLPYDAGQNIAAACHMDLDRSVNTGTADAHDIFTNSLPEEDNELLADMGTTQNIFCSNQLSLIKF